MKITKIVKYILIVIIAVICLFVANMLVHTGEDNTKGNENNEVEEVLTEEEMEQQDMTENNIIGTLEIPKINLKANIAEGIDWDTIALNIGHFSNSSVWNGNIALAAHNRGSEVEHYFENINQLEKGDLIIYKSEMGERRYKVNSIREIENTDWSVTENTEENKITLITCITNKPESRLCVQGILE